MGQDAQERDLPDVGALSRHVGASDERDLVPVRIEIGIIRNEGFACLIQYRMATVLNEEDTVVGHFGTSMVPQASGFCERREMQRVKTA